MSFLRNRVRSVRAGSATERQFEIIGEALRRLSKDDPACAAQIHEHQRNVAFRNILQLELPTLHLRVKSALRNL